MRLFCAIVFAIVLATSIASAAVTVKGLTYSIKSISRAASVGDDTYGEKASGEFIVTKLSVTNSGSSPPQFRTVTFT